MAKRIALKDETHCGCRQDRIRQFARSCSLFQRKHERVDVKADSTIRARTSTWRAPPNS